jgi:outer membrane lipoprotein-sorting protein
MPVFVANLAAAAGLAFCLAARAGSPAEKAVLDRWLSHQADISTWAADFHQTRRLKALTQPLTNEGRVWFSAPDQFRWEVGRPAQTIVARAGLEMVILYPRLKQAERYSLGAQAGPFKDAVDLIEAGFPRNRDEVESKFDVIAQEETESGFFVRLRPKSSQARRLMPEISLRFGAKPFALLATEMKFADGSSMLTEFSNPRFNEPADAAMFHPALGPEVKVVEPFGNGSAPASGGAK